MLAVPLHMALMTAGDFPFPAGAQPVQWRDSSLGCARGGGMYMQVITPGYRILVQAGDDLLEYHSAEGQPLARLCNPDVVQARDRQRSRDLLLAPAAPTHSGPPTR